MFRLNAIIDQLAIANSVCWYGHVLRYEDGNALRMKLHFKARGQRKE